MSWEAAYISVHHFLLALSDGWEFDGIVAEPIDAHHGAHSIIMVRGRAG